MPKNKFLKSVLKIYSNPFVAFVVTSVALYIGWYIAYDLILNPMRIIDEPVEENILWFTKQFLLLMDYPLIDFGEQAGKYHAVGIDGSSGVLIGDPCNGITLFALFAGFIIAFPGPWKKKLIFIPTGILLIHFVNIVRVIILCLITYYAPDALDFNHDYTFKVVVYGFVFLLWYLWVTRIAGFSLKPTTDEKEN